jgi:hypothetical protein
VNLLRKLAGLLPKVQTPVGAGATAAAVVTLALGLLNGWHWWASQSTDVHTAAQVVLTAAATYLAGWWNVVRQPGQQVSLELTSSALPTVQKAE